MKKNLFRISIAVLLIAVVAACIFACNKEKVTKTINRTSSQPIISQEKQATPQQILAFISAMGVKLEVGKQYIVTYMSGCMHKTEKDILWGIYHYSETSCEPGCPICEIKSIREVGGRIVMGGKGNDNLLFCKNSDGKIGLNVEDFHSSDFFDGAIVSFEAGQISNKKVLCFMVDKTKLGEFKDLFQSDSYIVEQSFALDSELAYNLGILPENQCIPAGKYPLYSYDDVLFWYIELDKWIK
ncbi:MAG: hypothetical protein MJZ52_04470 [Bacteroidales bacterium]|nr:hypothetical protein [Bacteroidales bacterium]